MTKYDKEKILRQVQTAYAVIGVVILAIVSLVFSTAWFSYELRRENELLKRELEKVEQGSDGVRVQVRSIEKPEYGNQRSYRRFDDAGKRPFRGRDA